MQSPEEYRHSPIEPQRLPHEIAQSILQIQMPENGIITMSFEEWLQKKANSARATADSLQNNPALQKEPGSLFSAIASGGSKNRAEIYQTTLDILQKTAAGKILSDSEVTYLRQNAMERVSIEIAAKTDHVSIPYADEHHIMDEGDGLIEAKRGLSFLLEAINKSQARGR